MNPAIRQQLLFINVAHLFTHYCLLILPTAVLAMAVPGGPFGADYGPILALATGGFVLYGVFALPQGWIAVHIGRHNQLTMFFLGTGLGLIATGLAPSPAVLAVTLGATGLFAAIFHPVGMALLIEIAGDKPGRAIGLLGVWGNIGVAAAPMITAFLAARFGWQVAFVAPGIACTVGGVLWMRVPPHDSRSQLEARPFPAIPRHLVRRAVVVLLLIAVISGLVFNAFTLLLPKLMQERFATAPGLLPLAGVAATVATLCGAVTQLTVGRMIDRATLKRVFLPMALALAPALGLLALAHGWMVLPTAGIVAAVVFGQVTVNETMAARYIAPALRTKMYSIRFFVGFLGSAAAAPLIAVLHERTGDLGSTLLVLAAFALVVLGCAVFFPNRPEELAPELWAAAAE
jgi:MFS family permease